MNLYRIVSAHRGLLWTGFTDQDDAEYRAVVAAVNTGRTVYLQMNSER